MKTIIEKIVDRGAPTILIACGVVMTLASFVSYTDNAFHYDGQPAFLALGFGLLLLGVGLVFYWWETSRAHGLNGRPSCLPSTALSFDLGKTNTHR